MAKKSLALIVALAMVFTMSACGAKDKGSYNYNMEEYVKLGDYLGIEVEKVEPAAVTEEAVTNEIKERLEANTETEVCTEGTVEEGMTVNLDYEGKIDGKTFDGGSSKGFDLIIGSGQFIDGFESGLVGKKIGDTVTLNLTFPDPYPGDEKLSGKPVEFTVKINSYQKETVPELNDKFVQSVSDCKTVDEYEAQVKAELEKQAEEAAKQEMENNLWSTVMENSEILKYPEEELNAKKQEMKDYYGQYAQTYGMELKDFLEMAGMTEEQFEEEVNTAAESAVGEELVMNAIADAEGLEISDSEYKEGAQMYVDNLGFQDVKTLEESYSPEIIRSSLLWQKVFDYLLDNAKLVDPKPEAADAENADNGEAVAEDTVAPAEKTDNADTAAVETVAPTAGEDNGDSAAVEKKDENNEKSKEKSKEKSNEKSKEKQDNQK